MWNETAGPFVEWRQVQQEDRSMRTPASIAGHPVHPMIVPIAIGGFILSFAFDIVCLATGTTTPWSTVAYYTMIGGIVGALCAAVFGLVDLVSLPAGHTRNIGFTHMGINLAIVALFICNAWIRHADASPSGTPFILSIVGIALLVISGWLGGKLVYEAGVGVSGGEGVTTSARVGNRQREA
jgi:uncharacterized membrane protein